MIRTLSARDAALLRIQCYGTCYALAAQALPYWTNFSTRYRRISARHVLRQRLYAAWRRIVLTPPVRE